MVTRDVVVEVLSDGELILYESDMFLLDEAADFLHYHDPLDQRHFFLGTIVLHPLQESPS